MNDDEINEIITRWMTEKARLFSKMDMQRKHDAVMRKAAGNCGKPPPHLLCGVASFCSFVILQYLYPHTSMHLTLLTVRY